MNNHRPILVVDPSLTDRTLLMRLLEQAGLDAVGTDSGSAAFAHCCSAQPPGMILLDTGLSDMSGFEACHRLKENAASAAIPILFVSAKASRSERIQGLKQGAVDFIAKPFDPEELLERVRIHSRAARAEELEQEVLRRKLAQASLEASEDRFRSLIRTSMDGFWLSDMDGRIVETSDTYCRMIGYTRQELLGAHISLVEAMETPKDTEAHIRRVLEKGSDRFESRHRHKNGQILDIEVSVQLIPQDGGLMAAFIRDLTEAKAAQRDRAALENQLQQAQKLESIGRLAGGIAHDFNNMLGVILGHAEITTLQLGEGHPAQESIDAILRAARKSAELTRQLLTFARKETVSPRCIDINRTTGSMLQMVRRLIGENIELTWIPQPDAWPILVDPSQIDQALTNLCVNARDAISGSGRITLSTSNRTFDARHPPPLAHMKPGEYLCLTVSDTGCGMSAETLGRIFEPFFTTKPVGLGTGLGLASVYGAVKQNGGFIDVASRPGHGSDFSLFFPRHFDEPAPSASTLHASVHPKGHETILVVEDSLEFLELTRVFLERKGYSVVASSSAGDALESMRKHGASIDLAILDVIMPGMNGRELLLELRGIHPQLRYVFVSGYPAEIIACHGLLDEGVHFLKKPFSIETLAAKIRELMERTADSEFTGR